MGQNHKYTEQVAGILLSGAVIQILDLLIVSLRPVFRGTVPSFAIGLWIGIASAVIMVVHMYYAIGRALKMPEEKADQYMGAVYFLRAVFFVAVSFGVAYFEKGYVMSTFLGMLCLKFGDLWKPLLRRFRSKGK